MPILLCVWAVFLTLDALLLRSRQVIAALPVAQVLYVFQDCLLPLLLSGSRIQQCSYVLRARSLGSYLVDDSFETGLLGHLRVFIWQGFAQVCV